DSLAYGTLGFSGAAAAGRGTLDSLTWFARSRMGAGGAFLAGGRFARRPGPAGTVRAVGLDSLAVQLPGDVWVLERPPARTVEYRDRRLSTAVHLWRSGQQILAVQAFLPLDLAIMPVERRQLADTLSVRATADSVDLAVLEALTPAVRQVTGVFSTDLGIAGTW